MAEIITVDDLPVSTQKAELVETMVDAVNARATRVAPCLGYDGVLDTEPLPSDELLAEAKLVLIGAVKRWTESGSGALQSQTAGPFGVTVDTRQRTGYHLWPSEIEQLQELCREVSSTGGAFTIDTTSSNLEEFDEELWWTTPTTWGAL